MRNLLCAIDVAGDCGEDREVAALHGEDHPNPDLVEGSAAGAHLVKGEGEDGQEEEDRRVDSLKADIVLDCAPNEPEAGPAEEAGGCNCGEELVIDEIDVSIVLEHDLDEVAKAHG
jgi:hypothetical protein